MLDHEFYVGRLGDLVTMPGTAEPVGLPTALIGGTHVSLTGGFTQDIYATKRSWSWSWPALTQRQAAYIRALRAGRIRGPLYLIDPREANRLPVDVAAGGSDTGSPAAWRATNNAVTRWTSLDDIPSGDHRTLRGHRVLPGAIEWEVLEGVTSTLELTDSRPRSDGRLLVPCLPGEPLELAGQFLGPSGVGLAMTAEVVDERLTVLEVVAGSATSLDPTAWARPTAGFTVPAGGAAVRVSAALVADTPPDAVWTTGWSLHRSDEPEVVPYLIDHCADPDGSDDLTDGFRLGGGAAQVVPVAAQDPSYLRPGLVSTALVLTER